MNWRRKRAPSKTALRGIEEQRRVTATFWRATSVALSRSLRSVSWASRGLAQAGRRRDRPKPDGRRSERLGKGGAKHTFRVIEEIFEAAREQITQQCSAEADTVLSTYQDANR